MGLRIRILQLDVSTNEGPFGVRLEFENGLNVIRATNSRGKSTCMNAILYALGLEGMLGPSHVAPFPAVMIHELLTDDDRTLEVHSSRVRMEISNAAGDIVAVERKATGSSTDRQLIRVFFGPALTDVTSEIESRVYHVRIKGSAQNELGFHSFLAKYLGLNLPQVATGAGTAPLYLECIAPFYYVDQLSGWDAVKSRMPTHLGILDVAKRSFEFVLALDVLLSESKRRELAASKMRLEGEWRTQSEAVRQEIQGTGVLIKGIPHSPADWSPESACVFWATDGVNWEPLLDVLRDSESRLQKLGTSVIPHVEQVTSDIVQQLRVAEGELDSTERRYIKAQRDMLELEAELVDLDKRLDTLADNLREYEDEQKIRTRHAANDLDLTRGLCPACHRPIKDALVDQNSPANPMSFPANIAFLRDQQKMFAEMRTESLNAFASKKEQRSSLKFRLVEKSTTVQTLKRTLRQDADAPSAAIVREQVLLEQRIAKLRVVSERMPECNSAFKLLADQYSDIITDLKNLGAAKLSANDHNKLDEFSRRFVQQLHEFGFDSYKPGEVAISHETYQPSHNSFPLGLVSASDMIRMVWAYLLSLLETARDKTTNHLGLLMLDEPKQHNVKGPSYDALLSRAAQSAKHGQQVIIATSQLDNEATLALKRSGANFRDFDSRIVSPQSTPSP